VAFQNCSDESVETLPITDSDNDGFGNVCDNSDSVVALAYCENGFADIFPCNDYDLKAWMLLLLIWV